MTKFQKIYSKLQRFGGIEITRTEITDIIVDEQTRSSQRQQLSAERTRRATIAEAEGEKTFRRVKS